ncbi:cysteine desulfurase family protein [Demequina sp. SYSU T00068]|uniref:cysteine desulfurase family protein n=1 Tax=Demequina lignilytica TaxID=3051663 RepID=UPI0026390BF8|nr:cysteine desulfurase family protein [Demequina sp. SYSU T00068]MDN4490300.1 cysteine desulfurase family protein [Demequina sp. SYSU T00068]
MHYLDHAATAPLRDSARAAWIDAAGRLGNPSSLHAPGRAARAIVEDARERIAAALGADPAEVVLTSGGTEADNLAVKGLHWGRSAADPAARRLIVSAVEHHAVLDAARWLASRGDAELIEIPVDAHGAIDLDALDTALDHESSAVSIMWANNEVGTVQPVRAAVELASAHGVPVHSDAVQAIAHLDVDFRDSGLAALSVSAHKLGGPVGVGALLARRGLPLVPTAHGGGQQRQVRSGTLDAAGAAAFAAALDDAVAERVAERDRLEGLRERLLDGLRAAVPGATVSGPDDAGRRLPGIVHAVIPGARAESVLFLLDAGGIAASSGSACTAGVVQASHVVEAMGWSAEDAACTLRLSMGRTTTADDVDAVLTALPGAVERARAATGA